jgi:hypothetical protein
MTLTLKDGHIALTKEAITQLKIGDMVYDTYDEGIYLVTSHVSTRRLVGPYGGDFAHPINWPSHSETCLVIPSHYT